jgi:hypothetical protein
MDGAATCERCGKPLEQLPRGRPRLYCGATCRKAAQRDRERPAIAERKHAEQLAVARAAAARAWRPLEATGREAGELAAAVLACAAGENRSELAAKIGELHAAVNELSRLAADYFDTTQLATRLAAGPGNRSKHP